MMLVIITVIVVAFILALFLALRIPRLDISNGTYHGEKMKIIDRWLRRISQAEKFNGAVIMVKNGNVIFENYYGLNGAVSSVQINKNSCFNLASVSKQFTAMGIVILNSKGLLDYDDELSMYIPELHIYKGVRIAHLLHHTSGMADYIKLVTKRRCDKDVLTVSELIRLYKREKPKLNFQPGEKFEYSNTGYVLLAEIIERVSQLRFDDFMSENIFIPLGMKDTRVFSLLSKSQPVNRVYGYNHKYWLFGGKKLAKDLNYFDGVIGDGGIYSSANDLVIWHQGLNEGKLVPKALYNKAYEPARLSNCSNTKYGFGWFLNDDNSVEHAGGWQGFSSFIYRDLSNDDCVVILDNSSNTLRVNSIGYRFNSIGLNLKCAIREL